MPIDRGRAERVYAVRCNGPCFCCPPSSVVQACNDDDSNATNRAVSTFGVYAMALERRSAPSGQAMKPVHPWDDAEFARDYPNLYAFLKDMKYADGTARVQGTISLFVRGDGLTWAINDNDRKLVAFVNEPTWAEALFIIDEKIGNDSLDWKASRKFGDGKTPTY